MNLLEHLPTWLAQQRDSTLAELLELVAAEISARGVTSARLLIDVAGDVRDDPSVRAMIDRSLSVP